MAVAGILGGGAVSETPQVRTGGLEFGDPRLDLGEPRSDDVADVRAGRIAGVGDVKDLADLVEGEPCRLGVSDEGEPLDDARFVVAVPADRAWWSGHQPLLLPEPERLGRDAGEFGDLPDPHDQSLDLPV